MIALLLMLTATEPTFRCEVTWQDKSGSSHGFTLYESGPDAPTVESRIKERFEANGNGAVKATCEETRR